MFTKPKNIIIVLLVAALALTVTLSVVASSESVRLRVWQSVSDPSTVWISVRFSETEEWEHTRVPLEREHSAGWRYSDFAIDVPSSEAAAVVVGEATNRDAYDLWQEINDVVIPAHRHRVSNHALRELWKFDLDNLPSARLAALAEDDRDVALRMVVELEALRAHVGYGYPAARDFLDAYVAKWKATARAAEAQRLYLLDGSLELQARWELTEDIDTGAHAEYLMLYCDLARAIYVTETAEDLCLQAFASTQSYQASGGTSADGLLDAIQQRLGIR